MTDLEPMLPPEPRASAAPVWIWALVVGLGAVTAYSGYTALSARQMYLEGEHIRADLTQQRDRFKANVADLSRQLEQANRSRDEVENALKQSRVNTEAASTQITDLQKQIADQQQLISELEAARNNAEAGVKAAKDESEKFEKQATALDKEVTALKAQVASTQKKLTQALADLKKEREQVSPVPMPPPPGQPEAGGPPPPR